MFTAEIFGRYIFGDFFPYLFRPADVESDKTRIARVGGGGGGSQELNTLVNQQYASDCGNTEKKTENRKKVSKWRGATRIITALPKERNESERESRGCFFPGAQRRSEIDEGARSMRFLRLPHIVKLSNLRTGEGMKSRGSSYRGDRRVIIRAESRKSVRSPRRLPRTGAES